MAAPCACVVDGGVAVLSALVVLVGVLSGIVLLAEAACWAVLDVFCDTALDC